MNANQITLLLNTYTKLKDVARLDSFIKTESRRKSIHPDGSGEDHTDELPSDLGTGVQTGGVLFGRKMSTVLVDTVSNKVNDPVVGLLAYITNSISHSRTITDRGLSSERWKMRSH